MTSRQATLGTALVGVALATCRQQPVDDSDGGMQVLPDIGIDAPVNDRSIPNFEFPAEVLLHVDGDTIEVDFRGEQIRVRFLGIQAPEIGEPFSENAALFVRQTIPQETLLGLEFDDDACAPSDRPDYCYGSFGRLLAYIRTIGEDDLGAELLVRGFAEVFFSADFGRKSEYESLEAQAQLEGVGIWGK